MRWGIVGTGAIAAHFAAACANKKGSDIVAVASRTEEAGEHFAHKFAIAQSVVGATALANLDNVDIIYIATPNHCHLADALAVIEAGKPVLCEKPLATNPDDAEKIAQAARQANVFCMEGLWSLCVPAYRAALAQLNKGAIGELKELTASFGVPQSESTMPRLFDVSSGGGALLDRGVYLVALSQLFLGPLKLVQTSGEVSASGVDLSATLILENKDGARAILSASIDRFGDNTMTLAGSRGRLRFAEPLTCPASFQIARCDPNAAFKGPSGKPNALASLKNTLRYSPYANKLKALLRKNEYWFNGGLQYEIDEVERCIQAGLKESPLVSLDSSIQVLDLVSQAQNQLKRLSEH